MNHVRIHGDPFGDDADASRLRSFLRLAQAGSMRCALSLSGVRSRSPQVDERALTLTDGAVDFVVPTRLPPNEVDVLVRAAQELVTATAPLVVFASGVGAPDAVQLAGLEWPQAATVLLARAEVPVGELLERVRAELRWAGVETPPHARSEGHLASFLDLPAPPPDGHVLHVGDGFAEGTDLVLAAFAATCAGTPRRLRIVLPAADPSQAAALLAAPPAELATIAPQVEVLARPLELADVRDAALVLQPYRACSATDGLLRMLASARPVAVSRFSDTAALLDGVGIVLPIGGRTIGVGAGQDSAHGRHFAPAPAAICHALQQLAAWPELAAVGRRGRRHVVQELLRSRPAARPAAVRTRGDQRPRVVLEAPLLENSSSAELTLATAAALQRRGQVDLWLVPTVPFRRDLDWLRARHPELLPCLEGRPKDADLWLSAGWPVRATRPRCRRWAVRVDWEYGSLPLELTPHVTEIADHVVVHSEHVRRTVLAAGRAADGVVTIPHGVDAAMFDGAPPDPAVMQFKGDLPAVLFCGGMIWRKGFDLFVRSVLAAQAAGRRFVVVVKSVGHDHHYGTSHLGGLIERMRATRGTPPVMVVERELSRAELASLYTACDVMLHPYRGEGFGLPVLEARACGLPVIATEGGATDALMVGPGARRIAATRRAIELPTPHVDAPWVLEPDAHAAAQALIEVLDDAAGWRRKARRLSAAVRTAFSWDAAAIAIERLATGQPAIASGQAAALVRVPIEHEPIVTLPAQPRVRDEEPVRLG